MIAATLRSGIAATLGIGVAVLLAVTAPAPAAHAAGNGANQPPTTPELSYAVAHPGTVLLGWVASTDDRAVAGYEIQRKNYYTGWQVIARVDAESTSYSDGSAAPFTNTYRVRAVDDAGRASKWSDRKSAIVHPADRTVPPPPGFSCVVEYYFPSIRLPDGTGRTSVNIFLTNFGPGIDGWQLTWKFPGDVVIDDVIRGASIVQSGARVVATSVPETAVIATGGTVQIDFLGAWTTTPEPPAEFTLNGAACVTG